MSTNTTTANSRYDRKEQSIDQTVSTFVNTVTDALSATDADSDLVESVKDAGKDVVDTVDAVGDRVEYLEERVGELEETIDEQPTLSVGDESDPLGTLLVDDLPLGPALRSKVTETDVEEMIDEIDTADNGFDGSNPTPQAGKDRVQTPLERVCGLPEHVAGDNLTANQERARFVAQGVRDYGRRVPAGISIRSSEIRRVLSASEESSIHTQTVTRVMEFLDDLGGDDVQVRQTRSGERVVVFDEDVVDRITHVVTHEDDPPVIEAGI